MTCHPSCGIIACVAECLTGWGSDPSHLRLGACRYVPDVVSGCWSCNAEVMLQLAVHPLPFCHPSLRRVTDIHVLRCQPQQPGLETALYLVQAVHS